MAKTALEALQNWTPEADVQRFLDGAIVLRQLVKNAELTDILYPLRGAMPLAWALEGETLFEGLPHTARRHELPLGTFSYVSTGGQIRHSSLHRPQKYEIIDKALAGIAAGDINIGVVDEVQGGGTIIPLIHGVMQSTRNYGIKPKVKLFPAEDDRSAAINRTKTLGYMKMVHQEVLGLSTTVVRMPLVFCDRSMLLDEIIQNQRADADGYEYQLKRNTAAEKLFRFLGSAARNPDIAYDEKAVDALLSTQSVTDSRAIETAPTWIKRVVHRQSSK